MIEVKSLSMKYEHTVALNAVSFHAEKGKILGLLGPNGAGKTTLMRILTSFIHPASGTAIICGHDVTKNPLAARQKIGYMPETVPLYPEMTVHEYLAFVGTAKGLSSKQLCARLDWVQDACSIKSVWKHLIAELSKGYRQRVGLAQALIHDPEVLILDEPTTGLDPLQIIEIRRLILALKEKKTIIFSTHILQEVEAVADRIVILNDGFLIAEGTRQELIDMATKGHRIILTVKGNREEIENSLRELSVADEIEFRGIKGSGFVRFWLRASTGAPLSAAIESLIKQKDWHIREFIQEEASLEEAFIWLLERDRKKGVLSH
jgi:ABC-2 type transport system ATP-binding protein